MEKRKILVVDDSPTILSILSDMLGGNRFELLTASNGKSALRAAAKFDPDLLLLDVEMPDMDGFETCRRFKKSPKLAHIPILFLSSFSDLNKKVRAFKAGAVDYIDKPVQKDELVARVNNQLELKRLQEQLYKEIFDKEQLIHILCHDVSNPLGCITGWVELIKMEFESLDPDALAKRIDHIQKSATQALNIIDHVREMEALVRQKKSLQIEPVALKEVVTNAMVIFENRLKEKNIKFKCIPDLSRLNTKVAAERVSFSANVFNNLLSNTIKFSFPGSTITLKIKEDKKKVRITLSDQGIGMVDEILDNIFDLSAQTSRPGTAGEEGNGFGMPLVKRYMDYYGGEIRIKSRPREKYPEGHGTDISLILKNAEGIEQKNS